jgi:flagellar biosynthetic protein FlhB
MSDERTEAPTAKRLRDLGARGDTARSQDLVSALALLAAIVGLQQVAPVVLGHMVEGLRASLLDASRVSLTTDDVPSLFAPFRSIIFTVLAGVTLPAAAVALGVGLFQTRGRIAFAALRPDAGRLNPLSGLRRLFGADALTGLVWPLLKVAVVILAIEGPFRHLVIALPAVVVGGVGPQIDALGSGTLDTARNGAMALVALATVDVLYRRWQFMRRARMTRQEVRDEFRQSEGDPFIRSRIRGLQRKMARHRMMHRVPEAQVVVTNPTHYAVALAYDRNMAAPEVVAKGVDLVAARIVEIARAHGVPVVPSPPLARALYRSVEVGQPIPLTLYQAVAEILAHVYTLRRRG